MKSLKEYRIPFVGLKHGVHYFNYEVDDTFFQQFEGGLIEKGKVFVDLMLDKRERVMSLTFDISGQVHVECHRCLAPLNMPIHGHFKVYVKAGRDEALEDDDVIVIGTEETHLDLGQHMHEFIQLSVPMLHVCDDLPESKRPCNWEVLKKLNAQHFGEKGDLPPLPPVSIQEKEIKESESASAQGNDDPEADLPQPPARETPINQQDPQPIDPRWEKLRSLDKRD